MGCGCSKSSAAEPAPPPAPAAAEPAAAPEVDPDEFVPDADEDAPFVPEEEEEGTFTQGDGLMMAKYRRSPSPQKRQPTSEEEAAAKYVQDVGQHTAHDASLDGGKEDGTAAEKLRSRSPRTVISTTAEAPTAAAAGEVCTLECRCAGDALDSLDPHAWLADLPDERREAEASWLARLSDVQFKVLRMKGTEEIHTGEYCEHFEDGTYVCSGCERPLYDSAHKFKSGHGWPAFSDNLADAFARIVHPPKKVSSPDLL